MTRLLAITSLVLVLVGCRAPTPSMNVFAPYGSATVPPPPTGAIGNSGSYYAPQGSSGAAGQVTSPATGGATGSGVQFQTGTPPASFMGTNNVPTPAVGRPAVAQASFEPGTTAGTNLSQATADSTLSSSSTPLPPGNSSHSSSTLKLNGMRVNDATTSTEPQQFTPSTAPINIADLPPANASQTPSFLRILNSRSSGVAAPPVAANTGAAASQPTGTWQTR